MNSFDYLALGRYLSFVCEKYQLHVCFKDFVGFISVDKNLDKVIQPFMAHTNPYCMYIKSDKALYNNKCRVFKKLIAQKCMKQAKPFYGICHAGTGEFIIPIKSEAHYIGAICVGIFKTNDSLGEYLIRKTCKNSNLMIDHAIEKYNQILLELNYDLETISSLFLIVSEYLGTIFAKLKSTNMDYKFVKKLYNSRENSILAHSLEYIKQNYFEPITVKQISNFCYCSESYINHIFKKRMGTNVKMYINLIRVEQAKNYLVNSQYNITDIASKVGFNDPNYFSRIFKYITGESPTEYKKRFAIQSPVLK